MTNYRDRTTNVGIPAISPFAKSFKNGSYVWPFNSYNNYMLPNHTSWIRDIVGHQGSNNPVQQVVVDLFSKGLGSILNGSDLETFTPSDGLFLPSTTGACPTLESWPWIPNVSSADLSTWSIEAFNTFSTQVPAKFSLANSLYELKDIKGLIPSFDRKSVTKTVGNNFLAYEFGVLPMISDIKDIVNLSDLVDKRIKHLISVNGKTTRLSFKKVWEDLTPYSFFISNDDPTQNDFHFVGNTKQGLIFQRSHAKFSFLIGSKLTQDLRDLEDANAKLKGLIAAGGFNRPARVIWNSIPYSFVVDWFLNVGKFMDVLQVQPFGGTYALTDTMWSLLATANYRIIAQWTAGITPRQIDVGYVNVRSFERYNGFPASSTLLTSGTLSPMQLALGLAMLNQHR